MSKKQVQDQVESQEKQNVQQTSSPPSAANPLGDPEVQKTLASEHDLKSAARARQITEKSPPPSTLKTSGMTVDLDGDVELREAFEKARREVELKRNPPLSMPFLREMQGSENSVDIQLTEQTNVLTDRFGKSPGFSILRSALEMARSQFEMKRATENAPTLKWRIYICAGVEDSIIRVWCHHAKLPDGVNSVEEQERVQSYTLRQQRDEEIPTRRPPSPV